MDLYKCMQVHSHKKADKDQYIITSWIIFIYHIEHNTEYWGGGEGTPHMKGVGMRRWDPGTLNLYQSSFSWILLPYTGVNSPNSPILE